MHDDVGSERERLLQHRRRQRVVAREHARRPPCAIAATPAMSVTRISGFDGVSMKISRVGGRIAASTARRSEQSAYVTVRPHGANTSSSITRML